MRNNRKEQGSGHLENNFSGMIVIVCVTMLLLGSLSYESRDLAKKLSSLESRAESLEREISYEKQRTQEIDALRAFMQTDAFAEQIAREKLGLVKDNEIVFIEQN